MNRDAVRGVVFEELARLAPEADLQALPPGARLREELDIDSFDFNRLLVGLEQRLGVRIPETDAGRLETLDALLDYLCARLPAGAQEAAPPGP